MHGQHLILQERFDNFEPKIQDKFINFPQEVCKNNQIRYEENYCTNVTGHW